MYLGAYDYTPQDTRNLVFFTVEDALPYNSFHLDFGPLNIACLYRFAVVLHNILNEESSQGKAIVFYSSCSPKARANAACLLCCYMVLVQSWAPHQVLQPICQADPPFQSFRDAGYSSADFEITIQDIVYGVWRAKERGLIELISFNLEEYEQYERVDQGDFNVIADSFIALASPQNSLRSKSGLLNEPFVQVIDYFKRNNVQLVVRLNSPLYNADEFKKRGIQHIDMIFDDGTCPPLAFVQKFIGAAECIINRGGKVAVHCKAGLGRTGCLIGAHLIYTHGFTANECIGYMRLLRPGMVVGPQQHWLYLHQQVFREWRYTMCLDNRRDESIGGLRSLVPYDEFKARMKQEAKQRKLHQQKIDSPGLTNYDSSFHTPIRRRKTSGSLASKIKTVVPVESPGQPRKYHQKDQNGLVEILNNSDEENIGDYETMQDVEGSGNETFVEDYADQTFLRDSPDTVNMDQGKNDWKVLRSISVNSASQPQLGNKSSAASRTVSSTLSSSSQSSPTIRISKNRSSSRITSESTQSKNSRVQSGGIRKISGSNAKKYSLYT